MNISIITIDGPTASGKGTVARIVAEKLHFHYLDSGALYRLTALSVMRSGINPDDTDQIAETARHMPCRFEKERIFLGNEDVTDAIRSEAIGNMASKIAAIPEVRQALTDLQTRFKKAPGLVADGRDMGTVVFPDAQVKIFLDASCEVRAKRRVLQLESSGKTADYAAILQEIIERDERDRNRSVAPLKPADDAVIIDSSDMTVEEVFNKAMEIVKEKLDK